jgi:hypothetical protein
MEKLIISNFIFFSDIIPGNLGGYLERRRTTMIYDNGYEWTLQNTPGQQSVDMAGETGQRPSAITTEPLNVSVISRRET